MIVALAGFVTGMIHVVSGPDHLAAIAPLAAKPTQRPWLSGLRWGMGHAAGVTLIGLASLLLRGVLPMDLISSWSERLVGVLLIGIGFWGLRNALRIHVHEHDHNGQRHVHLHTHPVGDTHNAPQAHTHGHAAFGIGTVHGLAGSSHFFGVLPALALPSKAQAVAYLCAFAVGTILAMAVFSTLIGAVANRWAAASGRAYRGLLCACSAGAFVIGGYWLLGGFIL
jgi:sulfite exporter TauE/SafE